ncbi:MAG: hypothetical protein DME19_06310 [Verrucomicrobia bacterium]|nr:MAG: hypothetical protein DME19_06310 [Verrucomicrobiota bacterium]
MDNAIHEKDAGASWRSDGAPSFGTHHQEHGLFLQSCMPGVAVAPLFWYPGFELPRPFPTPLRQGWSNLTMYAGGPRTSLLLSTRRITLVRSRVAAQHDFLRRWIPSNKVQDFSPFLTAPPPVPKELNVLLNHFLSRVTVREPESPIIAHIV